MFARLCGTNAWRTFTDEGPSWMDASVAETEVITSMLCLSRQTTLVVYFMSLVGMIVFTATLGLGHLWVVFITAGALG